MKKTPRASDSTVVELPVSPSAMHLTPSTAAEN